MTNRNELFLKVIIIQKGVFAVGEFILGIIALTYTSEDGTLRLEGLIGSPESAELTVWVSTQILNLGEGTLFGAALMLLFIAVLNSIEAWGLHLRRRWAEWFTVLATGAFIPFEIYLIIEQATVVKVLLLMFNVIIVYFLAEHKELFKTKKDIKKIAQSNAM